MHPPTLKRAASVQRFAQSLLGSAKTTQSAVEPLIAAPISKATGRARHYCQKSKYEGLRFYHSKHGFRSIPKSLFYEPSL
jgi:hypothetical protein